LRKAGVEVLIISPDKPAALKNYLLNHQMNVRAIADPAGLLLQQFGQEILWWRLGRMPAVLGVNPKGIVVYRHMGQSMRDVPKFEEVIHQISDAPSGHL